MHNFRQSEQEESSVLYSSELCAELLYFALNDSEAAFVERLSKKLIISR